MKPITKRIRRRTVGQRTSAGFTLVEVLVALVVLSIGLLGIGRLMLFSSRGNDSADMRTQATALAYAIIDDMRANRTQALNGAYQIGLGAAANPGTDCDTVACSTTTFSQYDLYSWKLQMQNALPTGNGTVTTNQVLDVNTSLPLTQAIITVQWNDTVAQQSFGAATAVNSITLETIL
jgi:type IV pilus assembly protein PilV